MTDPIVLGYDAVHSFSIQEHEHSHPNHRAWSLRIGDGDEYETVDGQTAADIRLAAHRMLEVIGDGGLPRDFPAPVFLKVDPATFVAVHPDLPEKAVPSPWTEGSFLGRADIFPTSWEARGADIDDAWSPVNDWDGASFVEARPIPEPTVTLEMPRSMAETIASWEVGSRFYIDDESKLPSLARAALEAHDA